MIAECKKMQRNTQAITIKTLRVYFICHSRHLSMSTKRDLFCLHAQCAGY